MATRSVSAIKSPPPRIPPNPSHQIHSTHDLITAAHSNLLPPLIMLTIHPQRWTNNPLLWTKELVMQNMKNVVKRVIAK